MPEYKIEITILPTLKNKLTSMEKEDMVVEYIHLFEKSVEENIVCISVKFQIIEEIKN